MHKARRKSANGAILLAFKKYVPGRFCVMRIRPTAFRSLGAAVIAAVFLAALGISHGPAQAQEPIKIGYSMAMTGGLGPNGQSALLAQKIWEEDINAKGGLLGRPVKLIYYDDQ